MRCQRGAHTISADTYRDALRSATVHYLSARSLAMAPPHTRLMRVALALAAGVAGVDARVRQYSTAFAGTAAASVASPPLPPAAVLEWTQKEIGVLVSIDMITMLPNVSNPQHFCIGVGGDSGFAVPPPSTWAPMQINTDQWLAAAAALGAKYAVLVTQHCSGFSQWRTDIFNATGFNYTYSVANSPLPDYDMVDSFVQSCNKFGVLPGFYYSLCVGGGCVLVRTRRLQLCE
jgi:hypothetical protein